MNAGCQLRPIQPTMNAGSSLQPIQPLPITNKRDNKAQVSLELYLKKKIRFHLKFHEWEQFLLALPDVFSHKNAKKRWTYRGFSDGVAFHRLRFAGVVRGTAVSLCSCCPRTQSHLTRSLRFRASAAETEFNFICLPGQGNSTSADLFLFSLKALRKKSRGEVELSLIHI